MKIIEFSKDKYIVTIVSNNRPVFKIVEVRIDPINVSLGLMDMLIDVKCDIEISSIEYNPKCVRNIPILLIPDDFSVFKIYESFIINKEVNLDIENKLLDFSNCNPKQWKTEIRISKLELNDGQKLYLSILNH